MGFAWVSTRFKQGFDLYLNTGIGSNSEAMQDSRYVVGWQGREDGKPCVTSATVIMFDKNSSQLF